jgi:hypothetical protein
MKFAGNFTFPVIFMNARYIGSKLAELAYDKKEN